MKLPVALLAATTLGLSGCASGQIGTLPVTTQAAAANVHVLRVSSIMGVGIAFRIAYDGQNIFDIRSGQVGSFPVPPGTHTIEVKCFGGLLPIVQTEDVEENFTTGKDYYFLVQPDIVTCASIQSMGPDQGAGMMQDMTPVPLSNN